MDVADRAVAEMTDGHVGTVGMNGGAGTVMFVNGGGIAPCRIMDVPECGGVVVVLPDDLLPTGFLDLSPSEETIDHLLSFFASSSLSNQLETDSLDQMEPNVLWQHAMALHAFVPSSSSTPQIFDLSKAPSLYLEAVAWKDAPVWQAVMDREKKSLEDMGAFEETDLPLGEKSIGLKWVYAHKTDAAGAVIWGKEKARVVAQGYNQRPVI